MRVLADPSLHKQLFKLCGPDSSLIEDVHGKLQVSVDFYSKLYSSSNPTVEGILEFLQTASLPNLTLEHKEILDASKFSEMNKFVI